MPHEHTAAMEVHLSDPPSNRTGHKSGYSTSAPGSRPSSALEARSQQLSTDLGASTRVGSPIKNDCTPTSHLAGQNFLRSALQTETQPSYSPFTGVTPAPEVKALLVCLYSSPSYFHRHQPQHLLAFWLHHGVCFPQISTATMCYKDLETGEKCTL